MRTVFLGEHIHSDAVEILKNHVRLVDNLDHPEEIDAIILRTFTVDARIMDMCPNLKVIGKHGVGVNTIDLEAAKERGIAVFNTPLANANSVAELIVGLMLNLSRQILTAHEKSKEGAFQKVAPAEMTGMELSGKTLGLIGMGNIARLVAGICRNGFGMEVRGYDPFVTEEAMKEMGYTKCETVEEVIRGADVVNVSVPLTKETENLISGEVFDAFRPGAILINAARGGIVNEDDLYQALKEKKLRGAACDAFVKEPPSGKECRLYELDNFIGTPHIGACAEEALIRMGTQVAEGVIAFLEGDGTNIHRLV